METTTTKELIEKAKSFSNRNSSVFENKTKSTLNGAFIGLVSGGMIGYYKKYNIFISSFVGAFTGGLIANILTTKTKE